MDKVARQLRDLIVASDEYRRVVAGALGVGVSEAAAVGELVHDGPLSPSSLVKRLGLASASITALLDRLELAGLVTRERHPVDRRSVLVTLTESGRAAGDAMFAMFSDDVYAAVHHSPPAHVAEFANTLARIAAALRARAADSAGIGEELGKGGPTNGAENPHPR